MPSFSATDRALAATGNRPVATSASHPSAAAGSLSNCSAISSAASRGTSAADAGVAPCISARTGGPIGTSGTPTSANRSAQSGGAHTSASAPSSRNPTASPASGSTSPRPPYVDNSTRISRLPFPQVLAFDQRFCGTPRVLPQAPGCVICWKWKEYVLSFHFLLGGSLLVDADVVDFQLAYQRGIGEPDVPLPLPVVVHHHVQDELHRALLDLARVGVFRALDAVDVPRDPVGLPVDTHVDEVLRVVLHRAGAVVVLALVHRVRLVAAGVVVRHEHRARVIAEQFENVDLGAVVVAGIGRQHPERGEEATGGRELEARLDEAVGELVEVPLPAGGLGPGGRQQPRDIRARPALAGRRRNRLGGRLGDQLGGTVRHLHLAGLVGLPAVVERRGALAGVPVEARGELAVVVVGAVELLAERQRPALARRGRYRRWPRGARAPGGGGGAPRGARRGGGGRRGGPGGRGARRRGGAGPPAPRAAPR